MSAWKPVEITVTVATAGTAVQISETALYTPQFIVQGDKNNGTDNIYVGGSAVDTTNGVSLAAKATISFSKMEVSDASFDLSEFYIDADNNGNVARVIYLAKV